MKSIWKFEVPIGNRFMITMPEGTQIIAFQMQKEQPCIWGIVELGANPFEERTFAIRGIGHVFEGNSGIYIGTVQDGTLVWHLFEIV